MRYTTRIIVPPRVRRSGPAGSPGGAYGPQVLGVRKTFGFGDRLGVATPAHIAVASAHPGFAPIFAQQSTREMTLTVRSPADVVGSAARAVSAARFRPGWGADADRLKTAQAVADATDAGFTFFTFDPSELVRGGVDSLDAAGLQAAVDTLVADGGLPDHWAEPYLDRTIDLPGNHQLRITLEPLQRAAVRYAPAIVHCARLSSALARSNQGRPFEIEVALDAVDAPATSLEHLFIGLELEARGVRLTGLALCHEAVSGLGTEDAATLDKFERTLREHVAVAEFCGPYKLCFHEVNDPANVYPIIGRVCGEAFHVKSSAASYLEALRVVEQIDPALFREVARYSIKSAEQPDSSLPALSAEEIDALPHLPPGEEAGAFLDDPAGRRCLDATFGSVLTAGHDAADRPFKQAILELLDQHADLYALGISTRLGHHLDLLTVG